MESNSEENWQICANCKHAESKNGYQGLHYCRCPVNTTVFRDGLLVEWSDCCDNFERRNDNAA